MSSLVQTFLQQARPNCLEGLHGKTVCRTRTSLSTRLAALSDVMLVPAIDIADHAERFPAVRHWVVSHLHDALRWWLAAGLNNRSKPDRAQFKALCEKHWK